MKLRLLAALIVVFAFPASAETPDNITLELRFENTGQVYSDGEEITSGYTESNFNYPYIVSDQPTGIVSYSDTLQISYKNISATEDKFGITQSRGSFLLPHTTDGHQMIEDKEDEVRNRALLNTVNPSFSFPAPTNSLVKVSYIFPYKIASFEGRDQDINQLTVRNKPNSENDLELDLRGS